MNHSIFKVNDEPYCVWEVSLRDRCNEYLNGIDTGYFDYQLSVHGQAEDEKRASVALKTTLHHAQETLFSMIGAYVQAADCPYAWLAKCSNGELREVVRKISTEDSSLFCKLPLDSISWTEIAAHIFRCYMPDTDKNAKTIELFSDFWRQLSQEFLEQEYIDEYNSIKHGFRVLPGGFSLSIGAEHVYGVSPPPNEMQTIAHSDFGVTYFRLETLGSGKKNRSIRSRRTSVNWNMSQVIVLIQLISMSICNLTTALKIVNGAQPGSCSFVRPEDDDFFDIPWRHAVSVKNFNMDFNITSEHVKCLSKDEINEIICRDRS